MFVLLLFHSGFRHTMHQCGQLHLLFGKFCSNTSSFHWRSKPCLSSGVHNYNLTLISKLLPDVSALLFGTQLVLSNKPHVHRRSFAPPDWSRRNELHFAGTVSESARADKALTLSKACEIPLSLQLKKSGCRLRSASDCARQVAARHGAMGAVECSITVRVPTGPHPKILMCQNYSGTYNLQEL